MNVLKKNIAVLALGLISGMAAAAPAFVQYQCSNGQALNLRQDSPEQMTLQQPWGQRTLPQVVAASGARYSDGVYTVWGKGDTFMLLRGEETVATDCTPLPQGEPLQAIRDAASGLVFIPPEDWAAGEVVLEAGATLEKQPTDPRHRFDYRFVAGDGQRATLLSLLVFNAPRYQALAAGQVPGFVLGSDGQRTYVARIGANPYPADSKDGKRFAALSPTPEAVQQLFSMYGIVHNPAVETVTVKPQWMERQFFPGALFTVELRQSTTDGKPGELIARDTRLLERGAPEALTLRFDPAAINPKNHYEVTGWLEWGAKRQMASPAAVGVLDGPDQRDAVLLLDRASVKKLRAKPAQ